MSETRALFRVSWLKTVTFVVFWGKSGSLWTAVRARTRPVAAFRLVFHSQCLKEDTGPCFTASFWKLNIQSDTASAASKKLYPTNLSPRADNMRTGRAERTAYECSKPQCSVAMKTRLWSVTSLRLSAQPSACGRVYRSRTRPRARGSTPPVHASRRRNFDNRHAGHDARRTPL